MDFSKNMQKKILSTSSNKQKIVQRDEIDNTQ